MSAEKRTERTSASADDGTTVTRMSREDRRRSIIAAATEQFARGGYAGTTTDEVAQAAGVSQPYVVRMFGGKSKLFRAVVTEAFERTVGVFEQKLDELGQTPEITADTPEYWESLGGAYKELVADRAQLLVLMHGFAAGAEPEIGALARAGMASIYRLLVDRTHCTPDQARDFLAHGMLINVLLAIEAPAHVAGDDALAELTGCTIETPGE
ncbi:TetR/AcrR family transcriptional regulator [Tomitella cavernea]|uniref:TetR family transcriptional regulator n=1 Tax=Tomitella cavernea TaxID=1387982 RepID=A0ABP9C1K2_9ACTN|nr:TetR/AcrR family transcriptional regulator [Tomitella cavernea]